MIYLKLEIRSQTKQTPVLRKQSWIIVVLGVMLSLLQPQLFLAAFTAGVLTNIIICVLLASFNFFIEISLMPTPAFLFGFSFHFLPSRHNFFKLSSICYAKDGRHKDIKYGLALRELLVSLMGKENANNF